ncbi:hypothetical_protein-conserved [Leishmania major strain Friedlin]|nr:hypothetical_protein-conserved [Leishmania major strain Friedlin]
MLDLWHARKASLQGGHSVCRLLLVAASAAERTDAREAAVQATTALPAADSPQLQSVDAVLPGAMGMPAPLSDLRPGELTSGRTGRDCRPRAPFAAGATRPGPLLKAYLVQIVRSSACTADIYTMQTAVVVVSTIYGVAFNGCVMTPPETRDTSLALKRAFDCLLTPAWLSRVLTLCSASSRDERTMDPVTLMLDHEQEHETGTRCEESKHSQNSMVPV